MGWKDYKLVTFGCSYTYGHGLPDCIMAKGRAGKRPSKFAWPYLLAKKLDMSVFFFSVKKTKRGYYETTFETIAENPHSFKDYEITDTFLGLLEKQIYEAPEYYLWTHKRWKHKDAVPTKYR